MSVSGRKLVESLKGAPIAERERAFLEAVRAGSYQPIEYRPIEVATDVSLWVATDAFKIGGYDPVRIAVTPWLAQRLSDELRLPLPTTKMADLLHKHADIVVDAPLQKAGADMSSTSAMLEQDRVITQLRDGRDGLISCVLKHWVRTNSYAAHPSRAANYGFYSDTAPYRSASGMRMWQTLGFAHGIDHTDYSQLFWPFWRYLSTGDALVDVDDVLREPSLAPLISSEGVLKFLRIPAVPVDDAGAPPQPLPPTTPVDDLDIDRLLELKNPFMRGDDVAKWQGFLGVAADGVFGPQTAGATRQFQRDHGLLVDGVVGPQTLRTARATLSELDGKRDLNIRFTEARNYTKADRLSDLKHIVIHTAEMPEKPTASEALASWVAGESAPRASWHYAVDSDSITQSVRDEFIAWHAPGANRTGIGIEHAGYARQSLDEWRDDFSESMLDLSAQLTARLCQRHGIPVQHVDVDGLKNGAFGITTHAEVSSAFKKSTHWDPGPAFPMEEYLQAVRAHLEALVSNGDTEPPPP